MLFEPVQPVLARKPTTGLVASAETPNDSARWQGGIAWRPERCPTARGFAPACGIEDPFETPAFGDGDDGVVYYLPPAFRVEEECSTRGNPDDSLARVRRQAEAITSFMVARELQNGTLSRSAPHDTPFGGVNQVNAYLASSAAVVEADTWEPYAGLGRIEELARQDALGQDVFIHIPVRFVPLLVNALTRVGNLLYTHTGAVVVADAGYTGEGVLTAGTAEVQTVTITGDPTGGFFRLTFDGELTEPIAFNATAADVQAALVALPNLDAGEVTVTGGPGPATPYTVTFVAADGNVPQMTGTPNFTGGVAPDVGVVTATPGVAPAPAAGDFLYATGPVEVRLGEIVPTEIMDWRSNRKLAIVDRMFAATFDPCNLHALAIDTPATT
jgi:hypothetical protein